MIPGVIYRYLMRGTNGGDVNIRADVNDGPQAALRAIMPTEDFYLTSSHGEPAADADKCSLTIDAAVTGRKSKSSATRIRLRSGLSGSLSEKIHQKESKH